MTKNNRSNNPVQARYRRAEAFEHETYTESMVLNARIYPNWISNTSCFWYVRKVRHQGRILSNPVKEYRVVNAKKLTNQMAFDHVLLANILAKTMARDIDPHNLPITEPEFDFQLRLVGLTAFDKKWRVNMAEQVCKEYIPLPSHLLISPDGQKGAFVRDHNLWVRILESGEEYQLTDDGVEHYAYGVKPERISLTSGLGGFTLGHSSTPEALWSPDSKNLLSVQTDEREILPFQVTQYVPEDGSVRPQSTQTKYALPGDKHLPTYRFVSINLESLKICSAEYPRVLDSVIWYVPFSGNRVWWSRDSVHAYFIDMSRGLERARLVAFNTQSGVSRILIEEVSDSYIDLNLDFENPASLMYLDGTDELIWFSERSGWAHIYLYDLTNGQLKKAITEGEWVVREVLFFDNVTRDVFIQVAGRIKGRNPYYREICRVNIDSGEIVEIASTDHDYTVYKPMNRPTQIGAILGKATHACAGVSPSGDYVVTTISRADQPPTTLLIDRDGNEVLTVETSDASGLPAGWQWPEPVQLTAADGKTEIFGLVFRPTFFSPDVKYPVLNWAMTNPFYAFVPTGSFGNDTEAGYVYMSAAAYAELGFIVVVIDGRGSCYRSKAFHNESYGQVHKGSNLEDHVSGIRQLAERFPYMDMERVGITDTGGANGPVYGMLAYPDFYKVGTVVSTWDVRLLIQAEIYQGSIDRANYNQSVLGNMAHNLKGKLLLIHGMMDPVFPISGALQLVDALVRENKLFDFLLLPNGGHAWDGSHYALRRVWNYLVEHLLDEEPPEFKLSSGLEYANSRLIE